MGQNQPRNEALKLILLVEHNEDLSEIFTAVLQLETSYHILLATTGRRATEMLKHLQPDVLLIDYMLPDMNGLALYEHLSEKERIPTILMSAIPQGFLEIPSHKQLVYLDKPFDFPTLVQSIQRLLTASPMLTQTSSKHE